MFTMVQKTLKMTLLAATVLVPTVLSNPTASAQRGSETFSISNESDYRIDHIYVSPRNSDMWGYDKLGRDVLMPDYHLNVYVQPGHYDVKMIDKDGDACVLRNVDLEEDSTWHVTNAVLLACEVVSLR